MGGEQGFERSSSMVSDVSKSDSSDVSKSDSSMAVLSQLGRLRALDAASFTSGTTAAAFAGDGGVWEQTSSLSHGGALDDAVVLVTTPSLGSCLTDPTIEDDLLPTYPSYKQQRPDEATGNRSTLESPDAGSSCVSGEDLPGTSTWGFPLLPWFRFVQWLSPATMVLVACYCILCLPLLLAPSGPALGHVPWHFQREVQASDNRSVGGGGTAGTGIGSMDRWLPLLALLMVLHCLTNEAVAGNGIGARPTVMLARHGTAAASVCFACLGLFQLGSERIVVSLRMLLYGN